MKIRLPKSLKSKLSLTMIVFTFTIAFLIASICFYVFSNFLKSNSVQSTEFNLQLISKTISTDIEDLTSLTRWCSYSTVIADYLTDDEIHNNKIRMLETVTRLREEYENKKSSSYISRLIIGNDSVPFMQINATTNSGLLSDAETASNTEYFQKLLDADDYKWIGLVTDPFIKYQDRLCLPVVRPIYYLSNHAIGWCFMLITTDVITDTLDNYIIPDDAQLYITIGDKTYRIENEEFYETNLPQSVYKDLSDMNNSANAHTYVFTDDAGKSKTMVTYYDETTGWAFSQTLSDSQNIVNQYMYYAIIILLFIMLLVIGLLVTLFMNKTINTPISEIKRKMNLIAQGDFSKDPAIEWDHELGDIGKSINKLSSDISSLMERRISDEKKKQELEYQILQNQVNPHFLYNTLNSIHWMANIQNAPGIAEMTRSLAKLLKSISKGSKQIITLNLELELLKDYILIQKYRYGGTLKVDFIIKDDDILECLIPKFTLQPLVENAIFHGIEPMGTAGRIVITAAKGDNESIYIEIEDNGVGMSDEKIQQVMLEDSITPSDFFKQIGISNVQKRIQFTFGRKYGIRIESKLGEFTKMTVLLPYKKE